MGLEVTIEGSEKLKRLAAQIKAESAKGMARELTKALKEAAEPVQESIRKEYAHLPARGGYAGLFSKSLRFRISQRTAGREASLRMLTFADGASQRRDINKLELGELRHPVYGRSRDGRKGERISNPWAVTTVLGGFHKRGTDRAAEQTEKQVGDVLEDFAKRLID